MELKSILEAILFVHGEPVSIKKLAHFTESSQDDIRQAFDILRDDCRTRGIVLLEKDNLFQIGSHPDASSYIEKFIKDEFSEELSKSALETLAIIAYKGPLTRAGIDYVRGVNSSFILRTLTLRGLVERTENPNDSRSFVYSTSLDFLKHLGVTRMDELPRYEEFQQEKLTVGQKT